MAALSPEQAQARALIVQICKRKGGVTKARREALTETDPDLLESLDSLREELGTSLKVFATELYNTDTRFVFELIQNAEDNKYERARAVHIEPFLTFSLYPSRIVVDSNEDGFDESNVKSICTVGDSTKKHQQGYVGEKGIGFKSVFRIASNVHIQSGPFSFVFEYEEGDSGMGMVTPFYREHDIGIPSSVGTRITLKLTTSAHKGRLLEGFAELPDSLLMFLTKIKKLTVAKFGSIHLESKIIYSYETSGQRGTLTKYTETVGSPGRETIRRYHITKRTLHDLPKHKARPKTNTVEVVLAFPLDPDSEPIIEQQHVFAYLPVRQLGFSFLIQSDFITPPNREDIPDSAWNQTIRSGIAVTFRDAVLQFCQHPTLQFQWMRYLPSKNVPGPFWDQLLPKTVALLKEAAILGPYSGGPLKRPHQLKWLSHDSVDQYGNPLFRDLSEELYLSSSYGWSDRKSLDQLGVRVVSMSEVLARVRADLTSPVSRLKSAATDEDWHKRSAKLLLKPFDNNWPAEASQVRKLGLIPLQDGFWVSGESGAVFNPYNDRVPVPKDLGLRLVDEKALKVVDRRVLFSKLGVKDCVPKDVVTRILARYNKYPPDVDLQSFVMHLRYLYWKLPKENMSLDARVFILDQVANPIYREWVGDLSIKIVNDLYFESDDEYGPKQLLSSTKIGDKTMAPGFPAHFINSAYLNAVSANVHNNDISWVDWLENVAQVQRIPCLVGKSSPPISDVFLYIIEHRSDKLVGTLKQHWSSYAILMEDPEIVRALSEAFVPCEHVDDTPLEETYLPLPILKEICDKFDVGGKLPFLRLPVDLGTALGKEWDFLDMFQVGREADLKFYMEILRVLVNANNELSPDLNQKSRSDIFKVYEYIEKHSKAADQAGIKLFFTENLAIYVPAQGPHNAVWASPEDCVWKAPAFYDQSVSLAAAEGYHGNDKLKRLFNGTLQISDACYTHYINQLKVQRHRPGSLPLVSGIYRHILLDGIDESEWTTVCEQFEAASLVYVHSQREWHQPSRCLWTDNTQICGRFAIGAEYAELRDFFVGCIGVQEPDVSMHVDELVRLANSDEPPPLPQAAQHITCQRHRWSSKLRNTTDFFAIIDRLQYGDLFGTKIPVLDFGFDEIHELRPFVSALQLDSRYMTHTIKETTTADGSTLDPVLSRNMREKAYAIYRCAVHYGVVRPQDQSLFRRLLEIDVYKSDQVSKSITLSVCGVQTTVQGASANLHLEDSNSQIRLYVPYGEDRREICYLYQIPGTLVSHLDIADPMAVKVIGDIVKASRISVLDCLLDEHGIVNVPGVESLPPAAATEDRSTEEHAYPATPPPTIMYPDRASTTISSDWTGPSRLRRTPSPSSTSYRNSPADEEPFSPATYSFRAFHGTPGSSVSPDPIRRAPGTNPERPVVNNAYVDLLRGVIAAAAQATFPRSSPTTPAPIPDPGLDTLADDVFGKRSDGQISHDVNVGAAGELYVFEMLLKENLIGFGRDNWKSTIRDRVCQHEKYRDMDPWRGPETADIVYKDVGPDYRFTILLESLGYLRAACAPVTYYLEVKTTKSECETRLFVSKAQYKRMQKMRMPSDRPATDIYIILRVFNLGKDDMGMRLYVDPAMMKDNGELIFEPESYTVIPGAPDEEL